ncbi:unnamed protein product [Bursaphelenchus xylophilus]|uniref:(pine wood nematode) hypothetical protein n=1 Tax=Bursaphelenchus xylophilus TaxID=6326 RepID=A0A1I7RJP6_BURXY|nr:unnamed protein product [Bursaphelenchus xylophilus]CAG9128978.1 unnamed protein product [Bursaphelenchus xylophilus]
MAIEPVNPLVIDPSKIQGDGFGIRLNNFGDVEYYGRVVVGTPLKEYRVVFDTGSTNFWIMSSKCRVETKTGKACKDKSLYNKHSSSTYTKRSGKFRQLYEIGFAYGDFAQDVVAIGTLKSHSLLTPNVTFGLANVIDTASQDDVIDGVMGLGFPKPGEPESLINRAVAEGKLEKPLYTVWMKKVGGEVDRLGGEILFGDVDSEKCEASVGYTNLTSTNYWQFDVNDVEINIGGETKKIAQKIEAISDTGTSAIVMPRDMYRTLVSALGIKSNAPGLPYVKCNTKFSLNFAINGRNYSLSAQDLMVKYSDGCVLQFDVSAIEGDESWVLGDPFIRTYCQIYDLGRKRVGFAKAKVATKKKLKCGKKCVKSGRGQRWKKTHQRDPDHFNGNPEMMQDDIKKDENGSKFEENLEEYEDDSVEQTEMDANTNRLESL